MCNKKCPSCIEIKPFEFFYSDKTRKDGLYPLCKLCQRAKNNDSKRKISGVLSSIYSHQIVNSKRRNHNSPNYSFKELKGWAINQDVFHSIYNNWIESNFHHCLKPSIDRIDDYKPYSLDNITPTLIPTHLQLRVDINPLRQNSAC